MKKIFFISQLLLALAFLIFGANGLIKMETGTLLISLPESTAEFKTYMGGLFAAKYIMPTVKIIEVLAGAFLLVNMYTNLALILLAPIVYNILLGHVIFDPGGILMSLAITILYLLCIFARWKEFKKFFFKI